MHAPASPSRGGPFARTPRLAATLGLVLVLGGPATRAHAQYADTASVPAPGSASAGTGLTPPRVGGYIQSRMSAVQDVGFNAFLNRARASVDGAFRRASPTGCWWSSRRRPACARRPR